MGTLTKEQILAAHDLKRLRVDIPEWEGHVFVKTITAAERDSFENAIYGSKKRLDITNVRARMTSIATVDETGKRLFDESDIKALGKKSAVALDRIFMAACKLNGMRPDDIEELEKNSSTARRDSSTLS